MSLFLCEVMPRICGTLHSVRHRSKTLSSTVLPTTTQTLNSSQIRNNCHRASITRIHRSVYPRPYKTMLCLQDGSTITVRTRYDAWWGDMIGCVNNTTENSLPSATVWTRSGRTGQPSFRDRVSARSYQNVLTRLDIRHMWLAGVARLKVVTDERTDTLGSYVHM